MKYEELVANVKSAVKKGIDNRQKLVYTNQWIKKIFYKKKREGMR